MSEKSAPFFGQVEKILENSFSLRPFSSPIAERLEYPEVEIQLNNPALLQPNTVCRGSQDSIHVERSINSTRISLRLKYIDDIEELLCKKLSNFLMQRSESFHILRRAPLEGYDISLLITHEHLETFCPKEIISFILEFIQSTDKEISEMKIAVNSRARTSAESFLSAF